MKLTVAINGIPTEIELTAENIAAVKKQGTKVTDRIKTFEDAAADQGIDLEAFAEHCAHLSPDEVAYKKLKIIALALNNGWVPDYTDANQYKYAPYFKYSSGFGFSGPVCDVWGTSTGVGSRLVYASRELAEYAGTQFQDIYQQYL